MLEIKNLSAGYRGTDVLKEVSLNVELGKLTALVGRNGCGKSTLLSCVNGMVDYTGDIFLNGKELRQMTAREKAAHIAFLPQILPGTAMRVNELVSLGRNPHLAFLGKMSRSDMEICERAMSETGIAEFCEKKVCELSGGERQRAFIAMILAQDTEIIMLDEPTTYMDVGNRAEFFRLLQSLRDRSGKTVLAVVHDLPEAVRYCDRMVVLDGGRVMFDGSAADCLTDGVLERTFGVKAHTFDDNGAIYTVFE